MRIFWVPLKDITSFNILSTRCDKENLVLKKLKTKFFI